MKNIKEKAKGINMSIKAVLFDMDGLMVDTESLATEAFIHRANKQGYEMTREETLLVLGFTTKSIYEFWENYFKDSDVSGKQLVDDHYEYIENVLYTVGPEKMPYVEELLKYLRENNYKIAVASSSDTADIKNNLEKPIEKVNILYNYFIKLLVKRLATLNLITSQANLIIKLDNKTIKVGSINTLEEYLQGEFYFNSKINLDKVYYVDSAKNFEIQLADFICNYYWRCYEKESIKAINIKFMKIEILYFPPHNFGI